MDGPGRSGSPHTLLRLVAKSKMNQAYVVCLPTQASSHPLAGRRALLGRACQEQFLAPACQPPVSACLYQNTECAALHWLGCMVNALHRDDPSEA